MGGGEEGGERGAVRVRERSWNDEWRGRGKRERRGWDGGGEGEKGDRSQQKGKERRDEKGWVGGEG